MEPVPESSNTICRLLHLWLMLVATGGVEPAQESPRTFCRLATFCRCLLLPLAMWNQYQNEFATFCRCLLLPLAMWNQYQNIPELSVGLLPSVEGLLLPLAMWNQYQNLPELSVGLLPSVDVCCCHWRCGTSTRISQNFLSVCYLLSKVCCCHRLCGTRTRRISWHFVSTLPSSVDA